MILSSCIYLSPRRADSIAAIMDITAPIMNDVCSDGKNAFERVDGNHVIPVNVFKVDPGIWATIEGGNVVSMALIGL